ncbi:MAG: twin-arginine translocase TatA/TatE family subunit [Acidimicrobiia bacterium]
MRGLGWPELILILVIVVVLFGATRLPLIARSIGSSAKAFRRGLADQAGDADEDQPVNGDD